MYLHSKHTESEGAREPQALFGLRWFPGSNLSKHLTVAHVQPPGEGIFILSLRKSSCVTFKSSVKHTVKETHTHMKAKVLEGESAETTDNRKRPHGLQGSEFSLR